MLDGLRDLLARKSLLEIAIAVLLGFAALHLIESFVTGFVVIPIREGGGTFSEVSTGGVVVFGRYFDWLSPLESLFTFALVLAVVTAVVRWGDGLLFARGTERRCPHCLSDIPVAAAVCSFCTRDVT